jgi:RNA-directed DNA polymerase
MREKQDLAEFLRKSLKLVLSEQKTLVTPLTQGFQFLGHHVCLYGDVQNGYWAKIEIPKRENKRLEISLKA